jgi:ABC-type dipeptide/oligopeptide/nickel transport system ATPase component
MTALRGRDVSMVFQNPMTALDPVFRVGWQLIRVIRRQRRLSAGEAGSLAQDILQRMSIPDPGRVLQAYPHELSGGMRQRVAIAMAMISRPRVLLADEPTTALDVTTQAGILGELDDLARSYGVSTLLISHDLGVIAATCDRCLVMQDGRIVESVAVDDLLSSPHHPHAVELVRCSTPGVGAEGNVQ